MRTSARVIASCAKGLSIGLLVLVLSACSRTVTWEEEVLLNTGTVIWLLRTDTYSRTTEAGNPFKAAWAIEKRRIDLTLHNRPYVFESSTTDIFMLFDRGKTVSIVAWSTECSPQGYAEYRGSEEGWRMQRSTDPQLVGQPRNLMAYFSPAEGVIPPRVSVTYKRAANTHLPQRGGEQTALLASRTATNCMEKHYGRTAS